jgi:hypothetical protein
MSKLVLLRGEVLQPASAATKNQAEVIYISDGKKYWVNYVINSERRKRAIEGRRHYFRSAGMGQPR